MSFDTWIHLLELLLVTGIAITVYYVTRPETPERSDDGETHRHPR